MTSDTLRPPADIPNHAGFALVVTLKDGTERHTRVFKKIGEVGESTYALAHVSRFDDVVGWRRFAPDARQLKMLRAIAEEIADNGRCHTGAVVDSDEDMLVLEQLGAVDWVDTDLCGHCDESTAHQLSEAAYSAIGINPCEECGVTGRCKHRSRHAREE